MLTQKDKTVIKSWNFICFLWLNKRHIFDTNQWVTEKQYWKRFIKSKKYLKKYEDSKKEIGDDIEIRVDDTQIVNNNCTKQRSKNAEKILINRAFYITYDSTIIYDYGLSDFNWSHGRWM